MYLSVWMARNGFDDIQFGAMVAADRATISRIRRGLSSPSWKLAARIKAATAGAVCADDFLAPSAIEAPSLSSEKAAE